MATSPLPSRGSPIERGQNQNWLPHPSRPWSPKEGAIAMQPLPSRGSPTPSAGEKIRDGCLTPAFSEVPNKRGTKSEFATSTLPSWGPKRGWNCYVTPAFSVIPNQKGTNSELAASPLHCRGLNRGHSRYVTPAFSGVPNEKGTNTGGRPQLVLMRPTPQLSVKTRGGGGGGGGGGGRG